MFIDSCFKNSEKIFFKQITEGHFSALNVKPFFPPKIIK